MKKMIKITILKTFYSALEKGGANPNSILGLPPPLNTRT